MNRFLLSIGISFVFLFFLATENSQAATIYSFDNPYLHIIKKNNRLMGYFASFARNSGCIFYFYQLGKKTNDHIPIRTYESDGAYPESASDVQPNGKIYISSSRWTLQASDLNAGCTMKANIVFPDFTSMAKEKNTNSFKVIKAIEGIEIKILENKHFFYDQDKGSFIERKTYLIGGDIVTILREQDEYSFVQYTNPNTSKLTQGWIKSNDMLSPFPK